MNKSAHAKIWVALVVTVIAAGCATVPLTDRQTLAILPETELAKLSLDAYQQKLSESKLSTDRAEVAAVERVVNRLANATNAYLTRHGYPIDSFQWEVKVIEDDDTVNAWCMPGGKMAVYTGILAITQDDAGLAAVMGHEIAHAIARHGNERMSQAVLFQLGGVALSEAVKQKPEQTQSIFLQSYGAISQVGVMLPFSRMHESEADRIGLTLMAEAGYDPRASLAFWTRMQEHAGGSGGSKAEELFRTHPVHATRIADIQHHLPEAMAVYQQRGVGN